MSRCTVEIARAGWAYLPWPPTKKEWEELHAREIAYQTRRSAERAADELQEVGRIERFFLRLLRI